VPVNKRLQTRLKKRKRVRGMNRNISNVVVRRMPRYYRYLSDLLDNGIERISSNELSKMMNVTASQIRQDLNNFGGFGQQGYGYNVEYLHQEIGKILGLDKKHHIIIIGAGHLGQALANYVNFEKRGFVIAGIFDINPSLKGLSVRGVQIRMMDELDEFVLNHDVDIAAFTMPKSKAPEIGEQVVSLGIKAIWNFANMDLNLPEDVIVENVHLSDSLMQLSYSIEQRRQNEE
jgi:redox-sensing transcriptional repressor